MKRMISKIWPVFTSKLIYIIGTALATIIISASTNIGKKIKPYFNLGELLENTNIKIDNLYKVIGSSNNASRERDSLIFLHLDNINNEQQIMKTKQANMVQKLEVVKEEISGQINRRFDDIDRAYENQFEVKKKRVDSLIINVTRK